MKVHTAESVIQTSVISYPNTENPIVAHTYKPGQFLDHTPSLVTYNTTFDGVQLSNSVIQTLHLSKDPLVPTCSDNWLPVVGISAQTSLSLAWISSSSSTRLEDPWKGRKKEKITTTPTITTILYMPVNFSMHLHQDEQIVFPPTHTILCSWQLGSLHLAHCLQLLLHSSHFLTNNSSVSTKETQ